MGNTAIAIKDQERNVLTLRKREGTKSFLDVPVELRKKDFESFSGKFFAEIMPPSAFNYFKRAILETGIEGKDAFEWLGYALSENGNGNPVSPIAQWVHEDPFNPRAFKYLYGIEDALTPLDKGYIFTSGAQAIYLRLLSLVNRLPVIIGKERKRFGMSNDDKYVIYNIGAAYGLDTIYMMAEHPELKEIVRIVHIDPDEESLSCGLRYAEQLDVAGCFEFIPKKIEETDIKKAHMALFIGMFCPVPTDKCITILSLIKSFIHQDGVVIFSTVQEKMLMGGPILDFIMWCYGWRMYFKSDKEPGQISLKAGFSHDGAMDWDDDLGYNRMTVARNS
ncbi:MAG: hypothetical protein ABH830_02740 [Patescibacteria group bacterium]